MQMVQVVASKGKQHAMIIARKVIVYCVHIGDGECEFSSFAIPLLPFTFDALRASKEGSCTQNIQLEISASGCALEAEVCKKFGSCLSKLAVLV
mmetsp:Transcript_4880/g.6957  ORF Transcript_4880/g.6957 Transcript_4880/m.6957 type:complete len:94 (+) Transcript_4880:473-754(+)